MAKKLTHYPLDYGHFNLTNYGLKIGSNQILANNRFVGTHKHSWNFEYEWVNSIEIQIFCFIRTYYNIGL